MCISARVTPAEVGYNPHPLGLAAGDERYIPWTAIAAVSILTKAPTPNVEDTIH